MPELNETPEPAASATEQPVGQAVESASVEATEPSPETTTSEETPVIEPRVFAGKYKTVEELEAGYQSTTAENSRMASDLARLRTTAPAVDAKPKYSAEQLETWKEGRISEVAQNTARAERFAAEGKFQEAQQHEAQAREAARQVRLIDGELRKLDIASAMQTTTRQSAEQTLMSQASSIVQQYATDLVPGTPLYNKAAEFLNGYIAMGLDKDSPLVQAQSVAMAAQVLGLSSKAVAQSTRKELTKTINTNLKAATVSGGGKSVKTAAALDFEKMSDAEFLKYKASRGWD